MRRYFFLLLAGIIIGLAINDFSSNDTSFELPILTPADIDPDLVDTAMVNMDEPHKIPDFQFWDQEGRIITAKSFDEKIYVADFFFTSCAGICPVLTKHMIKVQEAFANDSLVKIISHTVHPEKDSVAVLKEYGLLHGINSDKWHLLTGKKKDLYGIARKGYFAISKLEENMDNAFIHTENFILVDKDRHIRGIYNGTNSFEVTRLIEDIRLLRSLP